MKTIRYVLFAAAACSGGSSKPATTSPITTDPVPMTEPSVTAEPAKPTEPTTPSEPAKPAEPPGPDPAQVKAELLAAERAAFDKAKPVFDTYCAKCHTKTGSKMSQKKLDHFDMTVYPFGGHHATEMGGQLRKSLAIGGGKPTMPFDKKGAVKGDELALIAAWAEAFDASHEGGAHEGHGDQGHGGHKH